MVDLLKRIGWSQAFLAKRIKVRPATVCRWGKKEAPQVVILYLELLAKEMRV